MNPARVGVIGLGIMGSLYALHLLDAGFAVTGFDVDEERLQRLRERGGDAADSAATVVATCGVVITALSALPAFRAVMLDAGGAAAQARRGQLFIETGTLPIALKMQARELLATRGAHILDAPVTGTRVHAERKQVIVYASGDDVDFAAGRAVMEAFANDVRFVGAYGAGMKLKIITNLLVAVHTVAAAEALSLAQAAGLDLPLVHDLIKSGGATSGAFDVRGQLMIEGRFDEPTMRMDVFAKDIEIIGSFARVLGAATPLFDSSALVYRAALAQGRTSEDIAAVFELMSAGSSPSVNGSKEN